MVLRVDVNGFKGSGRAPTVHPRVQCAQRVELRVEQAVAVRESRDAIEADERVGGGLSESRDQALVVVDGIVFPPLLMNCERSTLFASQASETR